MVTLEDIKETNNPHLTTLLSKILYLMIEDKVDKEGWSAISLQEFTSTTGHSMQSVIWTLNKLVDSGLIEKRSKPSTTNHYRITGEA